MFTTIFLDTQNHVIECIEPSRGTLAWASMYPCEVVKTSLRLNTAAAIFAHNRPSEVPESSRIDKNLIKVLKDVLTLVDACMLDHAIVAGGTFVSFV